MLHAFIRGIRKNPRNLFISTSAHSSFVCIVLKFACICGLVLSSIANQKQIMIDLKLSETLNIGYQNPLLLVGFRAAVPHR
jgi:hypothetical protein